ncbi:SDR family oxidoreductase [Mesorhizobium sp.]|uniref:SDR family NAD(P)-dependent oxidoreductase n=1 Tax=Mesorhizobium sp. TaxID=1871066 RepID=UPI000FE5B1EA|nr:SDR family oxidoreductase [Mesorhizobium sp.]RWI87922.1 MAG: SDR family oxidoreductase [Mesorhizobium sp.]
MHASCLHDKVAIVTGAARRNGMGRAIALELAREGAAIVVCDFQRPEESQELVVELQGLGVSAAWIDANVTEVAACRRIVAFAIDQFGRVDILVNNAGHGVRQPLETISEADYDFQLNLHLKGPFFLIQSVVPHMRVAGGGRIVNISSELAYTGCRDLSHYSAAKAGLRGLTKALALELAPNITLNTVCPGPTATDKFKSGPEFTDTNRDALPLRRFGTASDVARSVRFLVTSDGDAFTGQTLDPNCGAVMN